MGTNCCSASLPLINAFLLCWCLLTVQLCGTKAYLYYASQWYSEVFRFYCSCYFILTIFQIALNIIIREKMIFLSYSFPPTTLDVTSTSPKGKQLSTACPEENSNLCQMLALSRLCLPGSTNWHENYQKLSSRLTSKLCFYILPLSAPTGSFS